MSDEPKSENTPAEDWVMPKPVFRTSEGSTPKGASNLPDDIPTEIANKDESTFAKPEPEPDAETSEAEDGKDTADTAKEPIKVKAAAPKPKKSKKRGCAKSFLLTVGMIAFAVIALTAAVIYFLFYYRVADTSTF